MTKNKSVAGAVDITKQPTSKIDQLLSLLPLGDFLNTKPQIAVIRLTGIIMSQGSHRPHLSLENLNDNIEAAFKLPRVQLVCLSVNSPGCSPVQSELIAKRIRQLSQEKEVPVVTFVEDVAASGGYWLACAGEEIYASSNSIIGSIGVISSGFGFKELISKIGVERRVYAAGKNKSVLDPFEKEKPEDVKLIKKLQQEIHENFIDYVRTRRAGKLTQTNDILFNGEFWTGSIAKDFGLIDGIDDLHSFISRNYGENVEIKYLGEKKSWLKKKLGITSITSKEIIGETVATLEEKLTYNRFNF